MWPWILQLLPQEKWLHNKQNTELLRAERYITLLKEIRGDQRKKDWQKQNWTAFVYALRLTNTGRRKITAIFSKFFGHIVSIARWEITYNRTLAPFRINLCAVALPKPEAPQVTRQIILCREAIIDFTFLQNSSLHSHPSSFFPLTPVLSRPHLNKRHKLRATPVGAHSS